jgi:hypothetical protein
VKPLTKIIPLEIKPLKEAIITTKYPNKNQHYNEDDFQAEESLDTQHEEILQEKLQKNLDIENSQNENTQIIYDPKCPANRPRRLAGRKARQNIAKMYQPKVQVQRHLSFGTRLTMIGIFCLIMTSTMPVASVSTDIIQKMNYPVTILIFTKISQCNPFIDMLTPQGKLTAIESPTTKSKPTVATTLIAKHNVTKRSLGVLGSLYKLIKDDLEPNSSQNIDRLTTTIPTRTSDVKKVVSTVNTNTQTHFQTSDSTTYELFKKPFIAIFNWFKGTIKIIVIILISIIFLYMGMKSWPCICKCIIGNIILKFRSPRTAFLVRKAEPPDKNVSERLNETDQNINHQLDLLLEEANRIPTPPLQIIPPVLSDNRFRFTNLIATPTNIYTRTISATNSMKPKLSQPLLVKTPTFQPHRDNMIPPPPPLLTCLHALQIGRENGIVSPKPSIRLEKLHEHNSNSVPSKLHLISLTKFKDNNTDTTSHKRVMFPNLNKLEL